MRNKTPSYKVSSRLYSVQLPLRYILKDYYDLDERDSPSCLHQPRSAKSFQTMLVTADGIMEQKQIPEKRSRFTAARFLTCNTITVPNEFVKTDMHVYKAQPCYRTGSFYFFFEYIFRDNKIEYCITAVLWSVLASTTVYNL